MPKSSCANNVNSTCKLNVLPVYRTVTKSNMLLNVRNVKSVKCVSSHQVCVPNHQVSNISFVNPVKYNNNYRTVKSVNNVCRSDAFIQNNHITTINNHKPIIKHHKPITTNITQNVNIASHCLSRVRHKKNPFIKIFIDSLIVLMKMFVTM